MEDRTVFQKRFVAHAAMRELFPDAAQRIEMANSAFKSKWDEASVTVTKLDGTQFFID